MASLAQAPLKQSGKLLIQYSPDHPANRFIPSRSAGAAFDGHPQGDIDLILTPVNIDSMHRIGLKPVSYRLRTELAIEAWHWNTEGDWSEGSKQQGYWTSKAAPSKDIRLSNGYFLPRRGNTHDQANDEGYSRIDDGDKESFWKSNPYLDAYYTRDSNAFHPQWVIADLGKGMPVNAIRILWGNPYALSYKVDYAPDIGREYFDPLLPGLWHSFSKGSVEDQHGEDTLVTISSKPILVRFVRITMINGSLTTTKNSTDIRDRLGFAIREIEVGLSGKKGGFHDWIQHGRTNEKQTVMHVSSTDPWHRAADIDVNTEQAGVDRFFTCGLTDGLPALMPVSLLYDTPDNMAALVKYLLGKHYPVPELEMGEEPEGQLINPQDYAALYCQWARVIKNIAPAIRLGGPCFAALATEEDDEYSFTERNWTTIFLNYLKAHDQLNDFNFFSFEWYPFDDICAPTAPQLAIAPQMLMTALKDFRDHILPAHTAVYVTEYGYSAHSGRAEVDIEGAMMYADILGQFLLLGGDKSFLYGYEPGYLDQYNDCSWGNNMLFGMDGKGRIIYRTAAYYGMQLLLKRWMIPADTLLEIYPVSGDILNRSKQPLISAYAIHRPDNKWCVLLINKDPKKSWNVGVRVFNMVSGVTSELHFPLHSVQYSRTQYHWKIAGSNGYPTLSLPPVEKIMQQATTLKLPPYSLTVINE
jgi:F5/8 type C domain